MHTTLHAAVVSHRQAGLIVTIKLACVGRIVTVTIRPLKITLDKNPESNRIDGVVSQGRSMTWGESLQCRMVRVGVPQCQTGGWPNHHGTLFARWAHNFKNVAPQNQNAICKLRAQYTKCNQAFNYLKCIVPQQLILRMQDLNKKILSVKNASAGFIFGSPDYQALDLTATLVRAKLTECSHKICN
jgi:hypothetical protein